MDPWRKKIKKIAQQPSIIIKFPIEFSSLIFFTGSYSEELWKSLANLKVGNLITKTIKGLSENPEDNSKIEKEVQDEVIELCSKFPIYKNLRK